MAQLLIEGKKIEKDIDKAIDYLKTAESNNNQFAQYMLGKLFLFGKDVEQDKELAVMYLQKSADQGNEYAQYLIEKNIKAIAIDVGGPDPLGGMRHIIHEMLLEKDIMIIESLHNLCQIKNKEVFLCAFPLKIGGGTGAPTRAVAMVNKE